MSYNIIQIGDNYAIAKNNTIFTDENGQIPLFTYIEPKPITKNSSIHEASVNSDENCLVNIETGQIITQSYIQHYDVYARDCFRNCIVVNTDNNNQHSLDIYIEDTDAKTDKIKHILHQDMSNEYIICYIHYDYRKQGFNIVLKEYRNTNAKYSSEYNIVFYHLSDKDKSLKITRTIENTYYYQKINEYMFKYHIKGKVYLCDYDGNDINYDKSIKSIENVQLKDKEYYLIKLDDDSYEITDCYGQNSKILFKVSNGHTVEMFKHLNYVIWIICRTDNVSHSSFEDMKVEEYYVLDVNTSKLIHNKESRDDVYSIKRSLDLVNLLNN